MSRNASFASSGAKLSFYESAGLQVPYGPYGHVLTVRKASPDQQTLFLKPSCSPLFCTWFEQSMGWFLMPIVFQISGYK
ncbi:hypothetical protein HanRHA438_Chr17g0805881 [Helianthus annuus]|nr:hypothetical protein HanRHA438_Chr17g0805881 [Helianthus annuus]